jgi:hypothetical protein
MLREFYNYNQLTMFSFQFFRLRTYATRWREKQEETNQKIRSKLAKERAVLIKDGMPSLKLQKVLRQIFAWYTDCDYEASSNDIETDDLSISHIMASRLWYRCGMKLSTLDEIGLSCANRTVNFQDFFTLITNIVAEDDSNFNYNSLNTVPTLSFEVRLDIRNFILLKQIYCTISHFANKCGAWFVVHILDWR